MASAATATETQVIKLFGVYMSNSPPAPPPITAFKLFGADMVPKPPVLEVDEITAPPPPVAADEIPPPATDNHERRKRKRLPPPHRQELPNEFRDLIASKGADVEGSLELLMGLRLTHTDMKRHHNRLSIPQHQIKNHGFLNSDEQELVKGKRLAGKRTRCNGIEVTVVDPSLKERNMTLIRWNADTKDDDDIHGHKKKNSWWYALTGDWIKIAGDNHLQAEDAVQIWSFRFKANCRLGFIVHDVGRRRRERQADSDHKCKKKKTEPEAKLLRIQILGDQVIKTYFSYANSIVSFFGKRIVSGLI